MKKFKWKLEYSITMVITLGIILLILPVSFFGTKEAGYISEWNDIYNKVDYMFSAMVAQADDNIVKNWHETQTNEEREQLMIRLVNPYLRVNDKDEVPSKYKPRYMNGSIVKSNDEYYFDSLPIRR